MVFQSWTFDQVIWQGHGGSQGGRLLSVAVPVISSKETLSHIITSSRRGGLDQNTGLAVSSSTLSPPPPPPHRFYNPHNHNAHAAPTLKSTNIRGGGGTEFVLLDHHASTQHVLRPGWLGGRCLPVRIWHMSSHIQVALAGHLTGSNTASSTLDAMQAYLEGDTTGKDCSSDAMPRPLPSPTAATAPSRTGRSFGGMDRDECLASAGTASRFETSSKSV